MEKVYRRRFSRLSFCADEATPGALVCAAAIFRATLFLSIPQSSETFPQQSCAGSPTAKDGKETAARAHPKTSGGTSHRASARAEEPIGAVMDAPARRCHHGTVLQQRVAAERTGRA